MLKKMPILHPNSLILLTLILLVLAQAGPVMAESSCVSCHAKPEVDSVTGKNYLDWKGSVHEANKVYCEACHKGDPTSQVKEAAHKGVFKASDNRGTIYFKNVPATCGACHSSEYNQFKKSQHYQQLEKTERGPNCVTCHGARATKIVTPPEMEGLCSVCHNERLGILPETPRAAHTALLLMNQTDFILELIENYIKNIPGEENALKKAQADLQQATDALKLSKLRWHTFDIEAIKGSTTKALESARAAWALISK